LESDRVVATQNKKSLALRVQQDADILLQLISISHESAGAPRLRAVFTYSSQIRHSGPVKRLTAEELDLIAARLEQIGLEEESLRCKVRDQVEEFGFTPPRVENNPRCPLVFRPRPGDPSKPDEATRNFLHSHSRTTWRLAGWLRTIHDFNYESSLV
jgi:hypothetical protein